MPMARAGLHESWNVTRMWSFRDGSSFSLPCWIRSAVNSMMWTILVERAFSNTVPVIGDFGTSRKSAGPFMVSMYWWITRHMCPHSPPRIHLTPESLGLGVDLGVEPLHHLVRGEQPEVAAVGSVGAPGVVEPQLVEEEHVAHAGVDAGVGDEVARRRDEQDLGALLVDREVDPDAGGLLDVVDHELQRVHEAVRLDRQVVAGAEAVGHRLDDPVDVEPEQAQQLPAHHGDLGRVDAVGAEDRAAPALGALEEVVEPLLDHVDRSAPGRPASLPKTLPSAVKSLR